MRPLRIAAWSDPSAAIYWRLIDPFKFLDREKFDARVIDGAMTEEIVSWADIVVTHNIVDWEAIGMAFDKNKKVVVDCDDYPDMNEDNVHKIEHDAIHANEILKANVEAADLVTCSTEYLASKLRALNPSVVVCRNSMDMKRWDLPKVKNTSETVRIGWAGSLTHLEDLKMILPTLKEICGEFPEVRLVFVGDTRIKDYLPDCPVETILGVPFEVWPQRLAGLRLDIGLAPLVDNEFNRCKSNIKYQEYSINQIAGVYSKIVYWHKSVDGKKGICAETPQQWYQAIKNLIISKGLREDMALGAYAFTKSHFDLKDNIKFWERAYLDLI